MTDASILPTKIEPLKGQKVDPSQILSDIVVYSKYARYLQAKKRRESWTEVVERSRHMMLHMFPQLEHEINFAYQMVHEKKALPSMRNLQFAGAAIEKNHARMFNCSARNLTKPNVFSEAMFLLLCGAGFSYSVQHHHIAQLPLLKKPAFDPDDTYVIPDTIEGWAESVNVIMEAYFGKRTLPDMNYFDIREKGAMLITSGGLAPGPEPLINCHNQIIRILDEYIDSCKQNGKALALDSITCFDIMCHIAAAVRDGGIRRSATLALFSKDDEKMLNAKAGPDWRSENSQREMANISACFHRELTTEKEFQEFWEIVKRNNSGEPGIYFTSDHTMDSLPNPCVEAALPGLCNLSEINVSELDSFEDFEDRAYAATIIGTLQSAFTKFHYLSKSWQEDAEREPLLGASLTGIASMDVFKYDIAAVASQIPIWNANLAEKLGIRPALRTTLVKPSGTAALVLGTSSGVHAWHHDYYLRRMGLDKKDALYKYLAVACPAIIEDHVKSPATKAYVVIPMKAPDDAVLRTESAIATLERVKTLHKEWIVPGHVSGVDTHNVSCTINIKDHEWDEVGAWLFNNRAYFNGVATIPYDCGVYDQTPFENITKEEYERCMSLLQPIDLTQIIENEDHTDPTGEDACAGGACELRSL